ncbi:MAG: type IX secretion system membrane protein PorP/SprF [Cytophagaceae bacterium]|nr:type IX secretion system membrane protein PorP/SprF [Cytophagaceae bacterium]
MRRLLFILCLFLAFIRVFGQNGEVLPVQFNQFYQNYSLVHPAGTGLNKSFQVFLGYQGLTGIFKGVNTSYAGLNFRLKSKDTLHRKGHAFGINIYNNREGYYFNRGRLSISYAWHNPISWNWILSGGISLGVINHIYQGSDISAGGSALKPNADIGVFLYSLDQTHFGLTFSQLVGGDMSPLESSLRIKRHINISADKIFKVSPYFSLMPAVLIRTPVRKTSFDADLSMLAIVQDVVSFGVHYKFRYGYSIVGGIKNIKMGSSGFDLFFSYYSPFNNKGNVNMVEATCIFTKKRLMEEDEYAKRIRLLKLQAGDL